MPFSARTLIKKKNIFLEVDIVVKKQIEMRFTVVCTLIDNDTRHHSGQNVVGSLGCTYAMTRIVFDKSTDHTMLRMRSVSNRNAKN